MTRLPNRIITSLAAACLAATLAGGATSASGRRFKVGRASDPKSKQHVPTIFTVAPQTCVPDLPGVPDPPMGPEVLGLAFEPSRFDEISVAGSGRLLAFASSISEGGQPGATKQVVLVPSGPGDTSVRITKVGTGDNDQPQVQFDDFGFRCVFRSVGSAPTTPPATSGRPSNIQLHTLTRGAEDTSETVAITSFGSAAADPVAFDPALAARVRTREIVSGIKVKERDARVAFVSTADLAEGANPRKRQQLFLWEEQGRRFRQLTHHDDADARVNRPSITRAGTLVVFESTADLDPDSVDPLDPSRVGNPDHVRQIFRWRHGRGVDQLTWSDGDCFAPRMDDNGRVIVFCSRGDPLTGGNPERNLEIFRWNARSRPQFRLRQLTQTALGDSVLPRPTFQANQFVFWSTARPPVPYPATPVDPDPPTPAFGAGPRQCAPQALVYDRGRIHHAHGFLDVENAARVTVRQDPASLIVTCPPAVHRDLSRIFFATNDFRLNPKLERLPDETDAAFRLRQEASSPLALFVGVASRRAGR